MHHDVPFRRFALALLLVLLLAGGALSYSSCSKDDEVTTTQRPYTPKDEPATPEEPDEYEPELTGTVRYDEYKLTAYHFNYRSQDPYGNPAILSAAITIGDEVTKAQPARGLLLYNRTTAFKEADAPTQGELTAQKIIVGSGLIAISADHYGFGATADQHQSYGIGIPNAQSSVDALIAAKKLLPKLGYRWNDKFLFNVGYSQGGQTALAVVRIITEQHPELKITQTIAGGGTYDICATYRSFIESDYSDHPGTVVAVVLAFNEFFQLNIPRERLFKEPLLSHIDEWYYSKNFSLSGVDRRIGDVPVSQYLSDELMDLNSETSRQLMAALDKDNLCAGWTPRKNEKITLVHHKRDKTVPYVNAEQFYQFAHNEHGGTDIEMYTRDWGRQFNLSEHETGAIYFSLKVVNSVSGTLGILPWVSLQTIKDFF